MSEIIKDDQDFFNLLIEETYLSPESQNSHLDCYSAPISSIGQQCLRQQVSTYLGSYKKALKCFRFKGKTGVIDFPQNWGPFSRALFYFDNNEKYFYGVYEKDHDPYQFCQLLKFDKIIFFCEGERLYLAGFQNSDELQFKRCLELFVPKEIKVAA